MNTPDDNSTMRTSKAQIIEEQGNERTFTKSEYLRAGIDKTMDMRDGDSALETTARLAGELSWLLAAVTGPDASNRKYAKEEVRRLVKIGQEVLK